MLDNHFEDDKYFDSCEQLCRKAVRVSITNSIAEQDFGIGVGNFDRLMKKYLNASITTFKARTMNGKKEDLGARKNLYP